jgi:hypothetical protein
LIISAKGTSASVLTPFIVKPNILLQTDVLAQQKSLNENLENVSSCLHKVS